MSTGSKKKYSRRERCAPKRAVRPPAGQSPVLALCRYRPECEQEFPVPQINKPAWRTSADIVTVLTAQRQGIWFMPILEKRTQSICVFSFVFLRDLCCFAFLMFFWPPHVHVRDLQVVIDKHISGERRRAPRRANALV